jgi:hypothetical protein
VIHGPPECEVLRQLGAGWVVPEVAVMKESPEELSARVAMLRAETEDLCREVAELSQEARNKRSLTRGSRASIAEHRCHKTRLLAAV